MSERTYQLAFRDTNGVLSTVMDLTGAELMRYSKKVNDIGSFLLTLPADLARPIMGVLDGVVQVIWSDAAGQNTVDGTYLLRHQAYLGEAMGDTYTIAGRSLEHLIWRRIFIAEDDPLVANGFSTKAGPADTVICEIIRDQCVSPAVNIERALAGLTIATPAGTYPLAAFREESSEARVLELVQKLARAGGVDFWIEYNPTGPAFTFRTGTIGTDRRKSIRQPLLQPYVYFAPQIGNLDQPELIVDRADELNHVYVFGQGPAGTRLTYDQVGEGADDSPWNDCEFGVQAKNTKTLDDWLTEAAAALNEKRASLSTFKFTPQRGMRFARYGQDWFLGDRVTAAYQSQEFEMRITGVTVTVAPDGEQVEPEMELLT